MKTSRGFTLLEVMVALAILAGALMALADLVSGAVYNHTYARALTSATLLARGKMVEIEQQLEEDGFKDSKLEILEGNFEDQGQPDVKWKVEIVQPDVTLSPEKLLGMFAGAGGADDSGSDMMTSLMEKLGGGIPGAAGGAGGNPMMAMLTPQVTAFGDTLKKSLREVRLTTSWKDGKRTHEFTVATHMIVLCAKAPGGMRGEQPDVCPASAAGVATPPPTGSNSGFPGTLPIPPTPPRGRGGGI